MSRLLDLITLLDKGPRTQREIAELTGINPSTVRSQLRALEKKGRVRPDGFRFSPPAIVWRWI